MLIFKEFMFTSLIPGSLANLRTKIRATYGIKV